MGMSFEIYLNSIAVLLFALVFLLLCFFAAALWLINKTISLNAEIAGLKKGEKK
jgi:hypothetical protein